MNLDAKISNIQDLENQLPPENFLIFTPPNSNALYTDNEILRLTNPIINTLIPSELSTVQKSQWVKTQIIELLRYRKPSGLRTKQARLHKPKFIHQMLDIFVQSRGNLQIWNYVPYADIAIPGEWNEENNSPIRYIDCRYLLVFHNPDGLITKTALISGNELADWDNTGTRTIKWQAYAKRSYRDEISSQVIFSPVETLRNKVSIYMEQPLWKKSEFIINESEKLTSPLIKRPPTPASFFTNEEIALFLRPLIGRKFDNLGSGQERLIGQALEKEIIKTLGYPSYQQTDIGDYPDLLHQLIEVKFQFRDTIDLGKYLPNDLRAIQAPWNKWEISPQEIRYVVALMKQDKYLNFFVDSIVITSGGMFDNYFSISEGSNFKLQISIPTSIMS